MLVEEGKIIQRINMRKRAKKEAKSPNEIMWKSRSSKADDALQMAYRLQLPIRVIVCDGKRRVDDDDSAKASTVSKRLLDPKSWAVISYDMGTGDCILGRDVKPVTPNDSFEREEHALEGFEGEAKKRFALHRKREGRLRDLKVRDALRKNDGRFLCEVTNCGFDFAHAYGVIGEGYAEVHHKAPLSEAPTEGRKIVPDDLAVVCSNCHAMIHRGGGCIFRQHPDQVSVNEYQPGEGIAPHVDCIPCFDEMIASLWDKFFTQKNCANSSYMIYSSPIIL